MRLSARPALLQRGARLAHIARGISGGDRVAVRAAIGEHPDREAPCPGRGIGRGGADLRVVVVDGDRATVLGSAGERLRRGVMGGVDVAIWARDG
jgi:hypothetical protein